MWSLTQWKSGCWCASILKICDQRIVAHSDEEDIRHPEQWMFVLWRPISEPRALGRPDAWGLTVGHPGQELLKLAVWEVQLKAERRGPTSANVTPI